MESFRRCVCFDFVVLWTSRAAGGPFFPTWSGGFTGDHERICCSGFNDEVGESLQDRLLEREARRSCFWVSVLLNVDCCKLKRPECSVEGEELRLWRSSNSEDELFD
jgi:hypothetical protein